MVSTAKGNVRETEVFHNRSDSGGCLYRMAIRPPYANICGIANL
jgi:hypothetical protein